MEDDEAASGAPEWFAFRQTANVAQAFGHDAAGMGEISMPIPRADFQGDMDDSPAPWGEGQIEGAKPLLHYSTLT